MTSYENTILRPAVLSALSGQPDLLVHVAPIEELTRATGRRRSAAELGAGTPDLLCSLRWMAWISDEGSYKTYGAQWVCLELKRPALPAGPSCTRCCTPCVVTPRGRSACCGWRVAHLDAPQTAGYPSAEQKELHAQWERAGRWVWVARTPAEALAAVEEAREKLRRGGLAAVGVGG